MNNRIVSSLALTSGSGEADADAMGADTSNSKALPERIATTVRNQGVAVDEPGGGADSAPVPVKSCGAGLAQR